MQRLTPDPVTLVCGFGRCGSSLVMQMLHAGGFQVTGEAPAFEDHRSSIEPSHFDPHWIGGQYGRAVKLLDPRRHHIDALAQTGAQYRILWLSRNTRQQAKSHAKMMAAFGVENIGRKGQTRWKRSLEVDTPRAIAGLSALGEVYKVRFEDIINKPAVTAGKLAYICGLPWDKAPDMASVVIKRPTNAMPDMRIEQALVHAYADALARSV